MSRLLLMALMALAGRAGRAGEGAPPVTNPEAYVHLTINDADSLDPAWANDAASQHVILQIYEPLLAYKAGSLAELEPLLAERVPTVENGLISRDRRTYSFPIRKGVRFHDGGTMTPEDARYSLIRFCLLDRDGGPSFNLLEPLTGRRATRAAGALDPAVYAELERAVRVEGGSVVVRLAEPFAPFLSVVAVWAPVVSRRWAAENGAWNGSSATWAAYNNAHREDSPFHDKADGTGPFRLERWAKEVGEIHLVRHDGYWRAPAALARAVVRAVPEWTTRRLLLAAGDADSAYADRAAAPELAGLPGVEVIDDLPILQANPVVFFNFKIEPSANLDIGSGRLDGSGIPPDFFADPDVRRAFAHALDARAYLRDVLRGRGELSSGCVPKGLAGHDPEPPRRGYDPARARSHFKKAWGGRVWEKGFKLTLTYNQGNAAREALARILKRGLEELNPRFKVDVRGAQWSIYLKAFDSRRLPLFVLGWSAAYPDPHDFAMPFLHSQGHFPTRQGFADAALDALIDKARSAPPGRRPGLYLEIQRRAQELLPQLHVAHGAAFRAQRTWVKGWTHRPIFPGSPWNAYLYGLSKRR